MEIHHLLRATVEHPVKIKNDMSNILLWKTVFASYTDGLNSWPADCNWCASNVSVARLAFAILPVLNFVVKNAKGESRLYEHWRNNQGLRDDNHLKHMYICSTTLASSLLFWMKPNFWTLIFILFTLSLKKNITIQNSDSILNLKK